MTLGQRDEISFDALKIRVMLSKKLPYVLKIFSSQYIRKSQSLDNFSRGHRVSGVVQTEVFSLNCSPPVAYWGTAIETTWQGDPSVE